MRPDPFQIFLAYLFSVLAGHYIVAGVLRLARRHLGHPDKGKFSDILNGGTEQFIATTLVWFAPGYVAPFIGAWIALKIAANWGRLKGDSREVRLGHLIALIGNAWSFAIAIAVGVLLLNPSALSVWGKVISTREWLRLWKTRQCEQNYRRPWETAAALLFCFNDPLQTQTKREG